MTRTRTTARVTLLAAALAAAVAPGALAQGADPGALASQYAANAKQNATLLRGYSWKMRVEPTIKGETKPPTVYQLRFDLDGKLQKTVLTAPPAPEAKGLGKRMKEKKIEEMKDWTGDLAELVKKYMAPTPGNMMDFYAKAKVTASPDGTAQVSAGSFLQPGDTATFWIDKATNVPVRYAFTTSLEGDPLDAKVDYGQVAGGPQYAARVVVNVPAKQVSAKIETFDYLKQ